MEKPELDEIIRMHDDYKEAVEGTEGKNIPGDDPGSAPNSSASQRLGSKLNKFTSKRL